MIIRDFKFKIKAFLLVHHDIIFPIDHIKKSGNRPEKHPLFDCLDAVIYEEECYNMAV